MVPKNGKPKQMPNEISLTCIDTGIHCRKYLQWYYSAGGNSTAFGSFKGRVIKNNKQGLLFKRLYIGFFEMDGNYVEGKEDHIWVFDKKPFAYAHAKANDFVEFSGKAYAYRRLDSSIDFSVKECENIRIIDSYRLPSSKDLKRQSTERLACEICLYNEHCYGICIAPDGWKENWTGQMLDFL